MVLFKRYCSYEEILPKKEVFFSHLSSEVPNESKRKK